MHRNSAALRRTDCALLSMLAPPAAAFGLGLALRSQRRVAALASRGAGCVRERAVQAIRHHRRKGRGWRRLESDGREGQQQQRDLFLVGTARGHPRGANLVRSIIDRVKPHVTAIEQDDGSSCEEGVRADNNEFRVAAQLGSKRAVKP